MKIKIFTAILISGALLLGSCGSNSAIVKQLSGADSLVITFNVQGTDSVGGIIHTTETDAIHKLAGFLGGSERAKPSCGFEGNMLFFKNGIQVLPVVFSYTKPDCLYFMYESEGKLHYTQPGSEAVDFLKSLSEGKSWY